MGKNEIEAEVRQFIASNFLLRDDRAALGDDDSLLEAGLIDSTGVLELVGFLETRFTIHMEDEEIVPANLDSVRAIVSFVTQKLSRPAS
jgi:acyl carrier protein